jgi:RHS repeat-associated protein
MPSDPAAGPYTALYTYDAGGNMISMPHLPTMGWEFKNQLQTSNLGGGGNVYFMYDAAGQRVRKVWVHSGLVEERIYLGGYEVYQKRSATDGSVALARRTLHVMDGEKRIALVETTTADTSQGGAFQPSTVTRFQLGNHLGSAALEVDATGAVISYEEYHPYGTTAYRAGTGAAKVSLKRYKYTGKERDEETGLYYHGARYYAPWLGRWTAADPIGMRGGLDLYAYVMNNPIRLIDPRGTDDKPAADQEKITGVDIVSVILFGQTPSQFWEGYKARASRIFLDPVKTIYLPGGMIDKAAQKAVDRASGEPNRDYVTPDEHKRMLGAIADVGLQLFPGVGEVKAGLPGPQLVPAPAGGPPLSSAIRSEVTISLDSAAVKATGILLSAAAKGSTGSSEPSDKNQDTRPELGNETQAEQPPQLPAKKTATQWRNTPGTAYGEGFKIRADQPWLKQGRLGHVPEAVAKRLRGQTFRNFDHFQSEFWKAVGQEPDLLRQFGPQNQAEILKGNAPFAASSQQLGKANVYKRFNLHHKQAIEAGGGVYDLDNILVASPLQHFQGLHR